MWCEAEAEAEAVKVILLTGEKDLQRIEILLSTVIETNRAKYSIFFADPAADTLCIQLLDSREWIQRLSATMIPYYRYIVTFSFFCNFVITDNFTTLGL